VPIPFIAATVAAVLALGGGVAVTVAVVNEANSHDQAVIERVIDGDTVDVRMDGKVQRVRLLNINAPEDNRARGVSECLGPEATAALAELLPKGAEVTLRYDSEHYDRYDRLLAGVFVDDTLVNVQMARAGFVVPMVVGDNTRFIDDVESAVADAKENQAGIFGASLPCTLGASVATYRSQVETVVSAPTPPDSAGIAEVVGTTAVVLGAADSADLAIDAVGWVTPDLRASYKEEVADMRMEVREAKVAQEASFTSAVAREKAEAERIAAEEAARVAAEKAAAEQAAAAQAAADQAAREAAQRRSTSTGSTNPSGGGSGDGGGSTYTGCRNYNGYGMIDTKGRHFAPIPCP